MSDAGQMDDVLQEFLGESRESLELLQRSLAALETQPTSREDRASAFRAVHTIKGACGFLGFARLEAVTRAGESLLARVRDGDVQPTCEVVSAIRALVATVRDILGRIEAEGSDGDDAHGALIEILTHLQACPGVSGGGAPGIRHP